MEGLIKLIVAIVNELHDLLIEVVYGLGFVATDKDLHFWVIGILGMFGFIFVQLAFRLLSKWSITSISFIYTFTVLLVVVFAIEIQQKITGRGNMEFDDAVVGLQGFFVLFGGYLILRGVLKGIKHIYKTIQKQSVTK
ncbi:hypothetical protein [Guptibacillus algicola]|uniref:hypothetical protein n=1 Tax=Guptibacillus algicola TaxID=225844 RepID=UPI001CD23F35|nr:hypothetical protein [Alkalihalobacillus algicola]MCA0986884.1 hypothetical protein [Alkalihalobacillus algicola]